MNSQKLIIDLSHENKETLEKLKKDFGWKYGNTVNLLVRTFGALPDGISFEMLGTMKGILRRLYRQLGTAGEPEASELRKKIEVYTVVAEYFNSAQHLPDLQLKEDIPMKKIRIKGGCILIPEDWIVVNPEDARDCPYAGIIECRNREKYGIPYMVMLLKEKGFRDYAANNPDEIYALCLKAWEGFGEILSKQIAYVADPEDRWTIVNGEKWDAAPNLCYYDMYERGKKEHFSATRSPYGEEIVRTAERN